MSKGLVLDLCGGTGSWSKPYKDAGFEVINVTFPEYDVRTFELPDEPIYGIFCAPPCTMFSLARTTAKTPRDFEGAMATVIACLTIVWEARYREKLQFWALENPRGYLRQFLGKPAMTFSPHEFGDRHTKWTDLWGYFKEPTKRPVKLTDDEKHRMSINNRELPELPEDYVLPKGEKPQSARRAMTPEHFAKAFFKANSREIK